jgi:predicted glycogen debranching enzyme
MSEDFSSSNSADLQLIDFGREICGDLEAASAREWLVTNGIGGYASGTISGVQTRRYHGLLVAALAPPLGRTLLVSRIDETVDCQGADYQLSTSRWASGTVDPQGYRWLESFHLEGTTPVWNYALADALLQKRIFMVPGANTTVVRYDLLRASSVLHLRLKVLVNYRDYHAATHAGGWQMRVERGAGGLQIVAFNGATPISLVGRGAAVQVAHDWYRDYDLAAERERGLDDREDHLYAGSFEIELAPRASFSLMASAGSAGGPDPETAWLARRKHETNLLERFASYHGISAERAPAWVRHLVLASDQFIVERRSATHPQGRSVIAGYHWFGDWGRDTMISLPGLTLSTGRPELAGNILRTFAEFVDRGMLPNRFPEAGETPEYNTADAALWYFEALRAYHAATGDTRLIADLFSVLSEIIEWHHRGTRYGIGVDPQDSLLRAGEPGVQLTWMDAKVGDWVVTPRIGKPVEINALWYNALLVMAGFARLLGKSPDGYQKQADRVRAGFERFWNLAAGYCFDVLDGPAGNEAALRPNQIYAVALPASPLAPERQRQVVDACAAALLTSYGLRSLAPNDPGYIPVYRGGPRERDGAYHQGTVWGLLLGPFALAHYRVYGDRDAARRLLSPLAHHLRDYGLGTLGEIFEADPPFAPKGCIAQAWTVSETLRAWMELTR